jgi:multisubunit Na+/H+ antiporter MnhE subunit
MRTLTAALGLGVLYVLTLVSTDPIDLVTGSAVGAVLLVLMGTRLRPVRAAAPGLAARIAWFPVFAGAVLVDVLKGTWDVALRVLHLRTVDSPGLIWVPLGERSDHGVAVWALVTTLSPGSVYVDIDEEGRRLLLHVLDASDPDAHRAQMQHFYDRYQRRVFP